MNLNSVSLPTTHVSQLAFKPLLMANTMTTVNVVSTTSVNQAFAMDYYVPPTVQPLQLLASIKMDVNALKTLTANLEVAILYVSLIAQL